MIYQYVILPFIVFTVTQAGAASFDCKKASSKLEHTIVDEDGQLSTTHAASNLQRFC